MKNQLMRLINTTGFSKFIKASAVALVILSTTSVHAQAVEASEKSPSSAVVTYLGKNDDRMLIQVQYDNTTGEKFNVTVKDTEGSIMFSQVFSEKKFDKNFRFPIMENDKLTFIIKNISERNAQTFEVNSNVRTVEEVVIKKVG
jgi:hypothetical protein